MSYPPKRSSSLTQDVANILAYLQETSIAQELLKYRGATGSVVAWTGTTPPRYSLLADGSDVSRSTYANLFLVTGTTFGPGDGSTTFTLPNVTTTLPTGMTWIIWT